MNTDKDLSSANGTATAELQRQQTAEIRSRSEFVLGLVNSGSREFRNSNSGEFHNGDERSHGLSLGGEWNNEDDKVEADGKAQQVIDTTDSQSQVIALEDQCEKKASTQPLQFNNAKKDTEDGKTSVDDLEEEDGVNQRNVAVSDIGRVKDSLTSDVVITDRPINHEVRSYEESKTDNVESMEDQEDSNGISSKVQSTPNETEPPPCAESMITTELVNHDESDCEVGVAVTQLRSYHSDSIVPTTPGAYYASPGESVVATPAFHRGRSLSYMRSSQQISSRSLQLRQSGHGTLLETNSTSAMGYPDEGSQSSTMEYPSEASPEQSVTVVAVRVEEHEEEQRVRRRILDEAVQADIVKQKTFKLGNNVFVTFWIFLVLGVVAGLSVGLTRRETPDDSSTFSMSPVDTTPSTLEAVVEAGVVRCGIRRIPVYYQYYENGNQISFEIELCRAIAAATLGDPDKYDLVDLAINERFEALANKTIDVHVKVAATMEREIYQPSTKAGFSFSFPYHYDDVVFFGRPADLACAESLSTQGNCSSLMVCVPTKTTYHEALEVLLPRAHIATYRLIEIVTALNQGTCNVTIGRRIDFITFMPLVGPNMTIGTKVLLRDAVALASRDDDPNWSDLLDWIIQTLFTAEEMGITKTNAFEFFTTSVFGKGREHIFQNVISAVGNYGDMYERYYEPFIPRNQMNMINRDATSGAFVPPDLGALSNRGPEPVKDSIMDRIIQRRSLICGISERKAGFAEYDSHTGTWSGLDVDYCRALAASLFFGQIDDSTLTLREVDPEDAFRALSNETIDVLCGRSVNLVTDILEPTSGEGFSFSIPYYYDNERLGQTRALVNRQVDHQWSGFVHWTVASTIIAESRGCSFSNANEMPEVDLFGSRYRRMFRNVITKLGNYGDMYRRNLEMIDPRRGLNLLNANGSKPHIRPFPFFSDNINNR